MLCRIETRKRLEMLSEKPIASKCGPLARIGRLRAHCSRDLCGTNRAAGYRCPHTHQLVSCGRKGEYPSRLFDPVVSDLRIRAIVLRQPKHASIRCALDPANAVSAVPRWALINGADSVALQVLRNSSTPSTRRWRFFVNNRPVPDRLIQVHSHEPAEQHAVVDHFHQQLLSPYRVQHLDQLRS